MLDIGVVIAVRSIARVEDAMIYPLDGAAHHRVSCELVVFRPCLGELLIGTIVGASADGLRLSLGFFEDVVVPSYLLQATSKWDARRRTWIWEYSDDSDDFVYTQHAQASAANTCYPAGILKAACGARARAAWACARPWRAGARGLGGGWQQVRFRVRSLHFTRVLSTAKGLQAMTTVTAMSAGGGGTGRYQPAHAHELSRSTQQPGTQTVARTA